MSLMKFPPDTSHEAQYSLPWSVATALVNSELKVEHVLPDKLKNPEIINLGQKISVTYDASLQEVFPEKCLQKITVTLNDGRVLESPVTAAEGDFDKPLSDEKLIEKFTDNLVPHIGKEKTAALLSLIENLEKFNVNDLIAYIL